VGSSFASRLLETRAPAATILVRVLVGWVFVSEGVQKFLFPDALGPGRFAKIGIPAPGLAADFVGAVEIACGALLLLGLATRLAAAPLVVDMLVAIATTKVPILAKSGVWAAAHESRTDLSMLLGLAFLLLVGAGGWSIDARITRPEARDA
jgi:uncharacterized membrane protein YphA (DoxX/SURF4 family)